MASQASSKIRVVKEPDDAHDQVADEIVASLGEQNLAHEPVALATTKALIAGSKQTLAKSIDTLRRHAAGIEQEMAQANTDYETAIATAKKDRDARVAGYQAELSQIKITVNALDGARAQLAAHA
ncbi:hypothetical protein [Mesorhizobium silamurunense]|uniref:hypothetical protein n=1 Tax=Mesorhizobium silamurunense TaxID=499528 RepID=UPI0017851C0C|nr:hypothetical protein [Mesorhizobium silamurunense]